MTTYHETFNLSSWDAIKTEFQSYIDMAMGHLMNTSFIVNDDEREWLVANLVPEVNSILGIETHIFSSFVTLLPPMNEAVLHIDGDTIPKSLSMPNWALNIPLYNYTELEETWYGGDYNTSVNQKIEGLKWIDVNFDGEPQLVASKFMDEPTLIRIDSPHRTTNHSEGNSAILSVRFTPDLKPQNY